MTDDSSARDGNARSTGAAAQPLDQADLAVLGQVRELFDAIDPVPPDLVERIRFAAALDEVYAEVATVTRTPMDALAVRSDQAAGTRTETLTFSADRLTVMITVSRLSSQDLRIDGWIAPAGPLEVRLRMQGERRQVMADGAGRFVFDGLPEGFAQLSFHPAEPLTGPVTGPFTEPRNLDEGEGSGVVVTPLFQL